MPARRAILTTRDLSAGYHRRREADVVVLDHVNVALDEGELVCVLGPNGAGKSTLLRTLAGVQPPLEGEVKLLEASVHRLAPRVLAQRLSLVLTDRVPVGNLSVLSVVALGRYPYTDWTGRLRRDDEEHVRWAMQAVGVEPFAGRNLDTLSDGERQKVMIARALAQDPALMILDEPTAHLDLPNRIDVMRLLRRLAHETGRAILLSTHELDLALQAADRIWLIPGHGPVRTGLPEDLVLGGHLEQTFRREGTWFDHTTGAFKLHIPTRGPIGLIGDGAPGFWTGRALERTGFDVRFGQTDLPQVVEVTERDGVLQWRVHRNAQQTVHTDLAGLLDALRASHERPRSEMGRSGDGTPPTAQRTVTLPDPENR